ncbi:MAG: hypothetical protein OJF55_002222 [Rhodanobacteraceae bacterium]|nr:MAG: hypothetical protein OJF55_002222 [Rhodanobacteraceae bacterium]
MWTVSGWHEIDKTSTTHAPLFPRRWNKINQCKLLFKKDIVQKSGYQQSLLLRSYLQVQPR